MQLSKRARIAVGVGIALLVLLALYALAGFVIAPRVLRSELTEQLPARLKVQVAVGPVQFNPFSFRLTIDELHIKDHDGHAIGGFQHLLVDFEPHALFARRIEFGRIELIAPDVDLHVHADGSLNIDALRPAPSKPAPAPSSPAPLVRVDLLRLVRGTIGYEDETRAPTFSERLTPVDVELRNFETDASGGEFSITGITALNERLEWRGHLGLQPLGSAGELRVAALKATTIAAYLRDRLPCRLDSGQIDLQLRYDLKLAAAPSGSVTLERLGIEDLRVAARSAPPGEAWITLPKLEVTGGALDLEHHSGVVQAVLIDRPQATLWRNADGTLNLSELLGSAAPGAASPGAGPAAAAAATAAPTTTTAVSAVSAQTPAAPASGATPTPAATPAWQLELKRFEVRGAALHAEDRTLKPAGAFTLAPLSLVVDEITLDPRRPIHLALDTRIDETGSLKVEGEVTPQPLGAALAVTLEQLDLRPAQPYLAQSTAMTLRSGHLSAELKVRYGEAADGAAAGASPGASVSSGGRPRRTAAARKAHHAQGASSVAQRAKPRAPLAPSLPPLTVTGDVHLTGLHTVDNDLQDDFVNARRIDVHGLAFSLNPDRLAVAEVVTQSLYARGIIEPDSNLNVSRVLRQRPAAPATGPPSQTPASAAVPAAAPAKETHASSGAPMPTDIRVIRFHDGLLNFTDLSVEPHFSAGIQHIEGSIAGLSSVPSSRARIDLKGEVEAYSPVTIQGEVNLLSAALYTDVAMTFRNIELSIFNPYSGKFAGYNIAKGKLTTELHYKVVGRQLDAQHHVVIEQLEFGDKTESKQAVSLPVKLAVALLKDRNGVITLDLPVAGSIDDPSFRIAPLIWKVVVNLFEKAVTAPFALLGRLFGGGPELQYIDFDPGKASLDAAAVDKMKSLAKALSERPPLKIDIPIGTVAELDREALVQATLDSELRGAGAPGPSGAKPVAAAAGGAAGTAGAGETNAAPVTDPHERLAVLVRLYQRTTGNLPSWPPELLEKKSKNEVIAAKIDFLTQKLREQLAGEGEAQLRALGEQRAQVLQQALLQDTGIDPGRVFIVANDKATAKDGRVRLELSLH